MLLLLKYRKVYEIGVWPWDPISVDFETKSSFVLTSAPIASNSSAPVQLQIKFPTLECVYQKEFLPLDMVFTIYQKMFVNIVICNNFYIV